MSGVEQLVEIGIAGVIGFVLGCITTSNIIRGMVKSESKPFTQYTILRYLGFFR